MTTLLIWLEAAVHVPCTALATSPLPPVAKAVTGTDRHKASAKTAARIDFVFLRIVTSVL